MPTNAEIERELAALSPEYGVSATKEGGFWVARKGLNNGVMVTAEGDSVLGNSVLVREPPDKRGTVPLPDLCPELRRRLAKAASPNQDTT